MTTDDLRALLDAAAKATPGPRTARCRDVNFPSTGMRLEDWPRDEFLQCEVDGIPEPSGRGNYYGPDAALIAAASPDVVASLARIALAAAEHERVRSTVVSERARNAGEYDAAINAMLQSRADLVAAIADAGLLTTAPQEPQP